MPRLLGRSVTNKCRPGHLNARNRALRPYQNLMKYLKEYCLKHCEKRSKYFPMTRANYLTIQTTKR